jgi:hypothetical protein
MATTPTTPTTPIDRASLRAERARRRRAGNGGQSLAEFALTMPLALLMVLFGLDFGRVFLGWVALNQAAREAANYAAMNPTAWTLPYNLAVQAEYARLVQTEASNINCTLESPVSAPTFGDGTSIGAPATVELTCQFDLITPLIGILTGNPIPISASSAFPIRSGYIEDIPVESSLPSATPAPSTSGAPSATGTPAPTVDPGGSGGPGPTPTTTPAPTATPETCTVVSLLNVMTSRAATDWREVGFSGAVIFSPLVPPHYRIAWQSLTVGTSQTCTSGITVRSSAP